MTPYWWTVQLWDQNGGSAGFCKPQRFVTGMLAPKDWKAAWVAAAPDEPGDALPLPAGAGKAVSPKPMPIFRKAFTSAGALKRAIVCVCGLGQYELRLNGRPVTDGVLNPGWTDYRKSILYNTYDVTDLLRRGENVLAMLLGNGMYRAERYPGRYTKFAGSFGPPKFLLQLKLSYADGREKTVVSDGSWRTRSGPVVLSSPYNEDFDARRVPTGWDKPDYDDTAWAPATAVGSPGGVLRAQSVPPIREARRFKTVAINEPRPGVYVYDLGENFAGWPVLTVRGPAGSTVKLIPGETLRKDGTVRQFGNQDIETLSTQYRYTLAGKGTEHWHPRFSSFGFRYLQVEGAAPKGKAGAGMPEILDLEGAFLHADLEQVGRFDCSNALFVRIHKLIKRALLSNTFSVLTDCPHREKLGWLEQTYLNADTVFCNEDALALYRKMQRDMAEAQTPDGMIPAIAPEYVAFVNRDGSNTIWRDSPEWGCAVVFSPLAAYKYSGDVRILADGYAAMQGYIGYIEKKRRDGLVDFGMGDWYDTGPKPPGPAQLTSLPLTGTATFYGMLTGTARVARLIGKSADAADLERRARTLKALFNDRLYHPASGLYDTGSQTACAMPLALGLVPENRKKQVLDTLVADIRKRENHVTAGDIGFHYVVLALMAAGRADVLYDMMIRTDSPSYGYQLKRGATALTEAWDANPQNSQNHFMLGHAESWFYRGLGGIDVDMGAPADRRITIAPQTVRKIRGVSVGYRSVLGEISCIWKRQGGQLHITADIPAGAQARVILPAADPTTVRESGNSLTKAGIPNAAVVGGKTVLSLGSGRYRFRMPDA